MTVLQVYPSAMLIILEEFFLFLKIMTKKILFPNLIFIAHIKSLFFFAAVFKYQGSKKLFFSDGMMIRSTKTFKGNAIIINFENLIWRHQKFLLRLFKYFDKFKISLCAIIFEQVSCLPYILIVRSTGRNDRMYLC